MSKVKSKSRRAKKVKAKKVKANKVKANTMNVLDTFMRNSNIAAGATHYLPDGTAVIYCG